MKYLIYTRVSPRGSDWQGETSCEAQADECRRKIAATDPAATFEVIKEEFKSARPADLSQRPLLAAALSDAESGCAAWDTLVVLDVDRLARSLEGCFSIVRQLQAAGKGLWFVRQNLDLSSPAGRFMLGILAAVASYFAESNAEKTRDKMKFMASRGLWPVRPPLGYKRAAPKDNVLVPDEQVAPTIREIYKLAAAGLSLGDISKSVGKRPRACLDVLQNPVYSGQIAYAGEVYQGRHEALIDPAIAAKVAERYQSGSRRQAPRPEKSNYQYILTGRIFCDCGGPLTPATSLGRGRKKYAYYRCLKCGTHIRAEEIEKAVLATVRDTAYSPGAIGRISDKLRRKNTLSRAEASPSLRKLTTRRKTLLAAVDKITDGLGAKSLTSTGKDLLIGKLNRHAEELKGIDAAIADAEGRARKSPLEDPAVLAEAWRGLAEALCRTDASPENCRLWVQSHVRRIIRERDHWRIVLTMPPPGVSTSSTVWHPIREEVETTIPIAGHAL